MPETSSRGSGGRFGGPPRPGGFRGGFGGRPGGRRGWGGRPQGGEREEGEVSEKVIFVNRSSKVVKGGRRFNFSALVVAGDSKGKVGLGLGKAGEVADAIRKGNENARKSMMEVALVEGTIPHRMNTFFGGANIILRPASPGTGVIAGKVVRSVLELAGVKNVLTKSLGSNNASNVAKATLNALIGLRRKADILAKRGIELPSKNEKEPAPASGEVSEAAAGETAPSGSAGEESASGDSAPAPQGVAPAAEPAVSGPGSSEPVAGGSGCCREQPCQIRLPLRNRPLERLPRPRILTFGKRPPGQKARRRNPGRPLRKGLGRRKGRLPAAGGGSLPQENPEDQPRP